MDPERSYAYHLDPDDPCFLSQTGRSDLEIVIFSPDAGQVDQLITKASELDASTVNNARTRFLHPSVWITLFVSALTAILYLFLQLQ